MRDSWSMIILQIVLCALCPFLIIPFWVIRCFVDRHKGITAQNALTAIFLAAVGLIAVVSPIITIATIIQEGFAGALNSCGSGFAIIIFEIHISLYILWKTRISKKLGKTSKSHKSICNSHQGIFIIGTLCYVAALFALWTNDNINSFFPTLLFVYGFAFLFWDLAAR